MLPIHPNQTTLCHKTIRKLSFAKKLHEVLHPTFKLCVSYKAWNVKTSGEYYPSTYDVNLASLCEMGLTERYKHHGRNH